MAGPRFARFVCLVMCAGPLLAVQTTARADVIGAEQFLEVVDRRAAIDRIELVLARSEVRRQLEHYGVDPSQVGARINALSDQELVALANNLDELPAGGSLLGLVGVVFVVLLILEFVGVIDIFKKV